MGVIVITATKCCLGCMEEMYNGTTCPHCGYKEGTAPESLLHLFPGTMLQDKYMIGRVLGQGGFGITYLAWDTNLNLKLAIKEYFPQQMATRLAGQTLVTMIKNSLSDEFNYGLSKFLQEARTLARFIENPNVVSVRDYFETNGTAYLVMNYFEGVTLQEYLDSKGGIINTEQALNIIMPVLDALKEVHKAGILHRDISPDNFLINTMGQVVLIDFGAARQSIGEISRNISVIMKTGYSPEEQYRSKGEQGPWTDIYSVAATLYRSITGQLPPEALDRLAEDRLVTPSNLGVKMELNQEQALLKALAVKAKDRFRSVEEFQGVLLGVETGDGKALSAGLGMVIPTAGKEKGYCPYCYGEIFVGAFKCKHCHSYLGSQMTGQVDPANRPYGHSRASSNVILPVSSSSETIAAPQPHPRSKIGLDTSYPYMEQGYASSASDYDQGKDGTCRYPKAGLGRRILAHIIDYLISWLPSGIAYIMIYYLVGAQDLVTNGFAVEFVLFTGFILIGTLWFIIYFLFRDGFTFGQSWGKKLCGLMVVDINVNQPCTKGKSVLRNIILLALHMILPIVPIIVMLILVISNEKGLHLGDMAARTQVINLKDYS